MSKSSSSHGRARMNIKDSTKHVVETKNVTAINLWADGVKLKFPNISSPNTTATIKNIRGKRNI